MREAGAIVDEDPTPFASRVADYLDALARALEQRSPTSALREKVLTEIRFQAKRLRRTDGMPFARVGWTRAALGSALDLLDAHGRCAATAAWSHSARQATESLRERGDFAFQRGATLVALLAVTDLVAVQAQFTPCSPEFEARTP